MFATRPSLRSSRKTLISADTHSHSSPTFSFDFPSETKQKEKESIDNFSLSKLSKETDPLPLPLPLHVSISPPLSPPLSSPSSSPLLPPNPFSSDFTDTVLVDTSAKDDYCFLCGHSGLLAVCTDCVQSFHFLCLKKKMIPMKLSNPEIIIPETIEDLADDFFCGDCGVKCTQRVKAKSDFDDLSEEEKNRFKWLSASKSFKGNKFYTKFQKAEDIYTIGDHVLLLSSEDPDSSHYGEILSIWEDSKGEKWIECRWYWEPKEVKFHSFRSQIPDDTITNIKMEMEKIKMEKIKKKKEKGEEYDQDDEEIPSEEEIYENLLSQELYCTAHTEEVPLDTIQCKLSIVSLDDYASRYASGGTDQYVYFCRLRYNDDNGEIRPIIEENHSDLLPIHMDRVKMNETPEGKKGTNDFVIHKNSNKKTPSLLPPSVSISSFFIGRSHQLLLSSQSTPIQSALLNVKRKLSLHGSSAWENNKNVHDINKNTLTNMLSLYSAACSELQLSSAPTALPCRENEHRVIYDFLSMALKNGGVGKTTSGNENHKGNSPSTASSSGLYIAGVPGGGKTSLFRQVIGELSTESIKGSFPEFHYIEINAMKLPQPHDAYSQIWFSLTGKHVPPTKAVELLDLRFKTISPKRPPLILLIDEIDFLVNKKQNVIYNLFDWPSRRGAKLIVVGISNTMDLPELLNPRVHSRMGLNRLVFQPYQFKQIETIVKQRLATIAKQSVGFSTLATSSSSSPSSSSFLFDPNAIELCSRKVAAVSGDVRRALQICRRATEMAEEEYKGKVEKWKKENKYKLIMANETENITDNINENNNDKDEREDEERRNGNESSKRIKINETSSASLSSSSPTLSLSLSPFPSLTPVSMSHVDRAISDLQNHHLLDILSHLRLLPKLFLAALSSETIIRHEVGEWEFLSIADRAIRLAQSKGFQHVPKHWELLGAIDTLTQMNIITADFNYQYTNSHNKDDTSEEKFNRLREREEEREEEIQRKTNGKGQETDKDGDTPMKNIQESSGKRGPGRPKFSSSPSPSSSSPSPSPSSSSKGNSVSKYISTSYSSSYTSPQYPLIRLGVGVTLPPQSFFNLEK